MPITETDVDDFKINYLTQEQYEAEKSAGRLNPNELYLTPSSSEDEDAVTEETVSSWGFIKTINGTSPDDNGNVSLNLGLTFDSLINSVGYSYTYNSTTGLETVLKNGVSYATRLTEKIENGYSITINYPSAGINNLTRLCTVDEDGVWTFTDFH